MSTIDPDFFWEELLSGEPQRAQAVFAPLSNDEKRAVRAHLGRMVSESGWQAAQRKSARAALNALEENSHGNP